MHPEADALLDAIFDNPDEDTPRLVYADWLQEHDQENYAQFIRLQCAAAREKLWSDEANRLWVEIGRVWYRLLDEWWPATVEDWDALRLGLLDAAHFERGFLRESIYLTFIQIVRYGNSCWPWLPFPVTTTAPDLGNYSPDIATFSRLSRIRHLKLADWSGDDDDIWSLITSPHLTRLEVLDMTAGVISVEAAERLLLPGTLPRLRELRVQVYDEEWEVAARFARLAGEPIPLASFVPELRRRLESRFEKVDLKPYQ